jgi:demethoxyubiquinone hydroxylase (CLK1/Coq7/Cat5 family)
MILPQHAGVANAIGAVVGQISQRASAIVTSPSEGRYTAHLAEGLQNFNSQDTALAAVEAALTAEASGRAQAAGAADLRISVTRDIREASVEGRAMFVEARISVTASGRPRVAHAPNPT